MADNAVDRNLLFAVIALQNNFIDQADLIAAFHSWSADRARPLGQVLVARGVLKDEEHALVEVLVGKHLQKHGGDVRTTLGAVADAAARDAIRSLDDSEVRKSISSLPDAAGYVLVETLIPPTETRSRYQLTRLHAQGGLGRIWLARDTDLNRDVALKEILPERAAHPEMWRRFLKEAQVTGQLEHPNIVPVYELARRAEDDQPFYTMRFVRGRTLRRAIAEHHQHRSEGKVNPLEKPRLLQAFISVCQAIGYAHSRGVIHRDLKPENVIMGGFGEVLVLDWGLAKMVDRPEEEIDLASLSITDDAETEATHAGQRLGTPAYMAPEQAEGSLDLVDARTDIYGLGAILFEILTGRPPHQGKTLVGLLFQIASGETPRARSVEPSVPASLDAICARAMAKARADRYPKATELAEDVQRWLADEPVSAHREGWGLRLARWSRRHRAWVQAGAASLTLILLLSIVFAIQQTRSADRLRDEQTRTKDALKTVVTERDRTRRENRKALQSLSDFYLERGRSLAEGREPRGLLWVARALANAPADDAARQRVIRTTYSAEVGQIHELKAILPSSAVVYAVAFSPDGKTVLTGSGDKTARVWDAADGTPIGQPLVHQDFVVDAAFSPDGKSVLTGSYDKTARLWDAADGRPIGQPMVHQEFVAAVAFNPDGKSVLTVTLVCTARHWSAVEGTPIGQPMVHQESVEAVAFSPDGKSFLTASQDGTSRLWDAADGKPIGQPMVHQATVRAMAFSPDGKSVLTGSWDNTARLWDAADGRPIDQPMVHQGPVGAVAFSPDGKSVLTGSRDKTARLWRVPGEIAGEPRRIMLWTEVRTGFEFDNETNATQILDAKTWEDRRRQLTEMGGPPVQIHHAASRRSP